MSSRTSTTGASRDVETRGSDVWADAASQLGASLRRSALLICVLTVLGALLAPFVLLAVPKSYRATSQVLIDPRGLQVFPTEQGGPVMDANAGVNFVETQLQLFTSQGVLSRVVRADPDKDAAAREDETSGEQDDLGLRPSLEADGGGPEQRAIASLRRNLTIKRGERSFLVSVTAKAATAERAAWIANAVVKAFMEEDTASRAEAGRRLNDEIAGRLTALRDQLAQSESKAETFRAEHGLVSSGNDRLVSEQRLEQAVADLGSAQDRFGRAQARVSQLDSASLDVGSLGPLTAADDMRTISYLIERLSAAQEALADARLQLGPRHPTFESARSRVETIQQRIRSEIARVREAERTSLNRAKGELDAGKRNVSELSAAVSKDRKAWGELRALYAQVKANQEVLAAFEARSREAAEFSRVSPANIRIASTATLDPSSSRLIMAAALSIAGAIFGAMLGLAWAAFSAFAWPVRRAPAAEARPVFEDAPPAPGRFAAHHHAPRPG